MNAANEKSISFFVGRQACRAPAGQTVLTALREAGFTVPSLCHHPRLEPYGACRLCLVEIERGTKRLLTTSCNCPLLEGDRILLDTDRVVRHRSRVLELLLAMAPDSPQLARLASRYGVLQTRFVPQADSDGCILCGLCSRVCSQVVGAGAITLAGRGEKRVLARRPFAEFPESCIGCGACALLCPTGAISMEAVAVARLRDRWGQIRPCRYALMGLLPGSVCENDYACWRCEVDQRMIDRAEGEHPVFLREDTTEARR